MSADIASAIGARLMPFVRRQRGGIMGNNDPMDRDGSVGAVRAVVIGGAGDGQHIVTLGQPTLELMEQEAPIALRQVNDLSEVAVKRHRYNLEWIRSGSRKFALYVIEGMSHEDAMGMLLAGYRGGDAD